MLEPYARRAVPPGDSHGCGPSLRKATVTPHACERELPEERAQPHLVVPLTGTETLTNRTRPLGRRVIRDLLGNDGLLQLMPYGLRFCPRQPQCLRLDSSPFERCHRVAGAHPLRQGTFRP